MQLISFVLKYPTRDLKDTSGIFQNERDHLVLMINTSGQHTHTQINKSIYCMSLTINKLYIGAAR